MPCSPSDASTARSGGSCCAKDKSCQKPSHSGTHSHSGPESESDSCCGESTTKRNVVLIQSHDHEGKIEETNACCSASTVSPSKDCCSSHEDHAAGLVQKSTCDKDCCASDVASHSSHHPSDDHCHGDCCDHGETPRQSVSSEVRKEETVRNAICACCIGTALAQSEAAFRARLARFNDASERLHKCCVAFADLCCARFTDKRTNTCCTKECQDEKTPLLGGQNLVTHLSQSEKILTAEELAAIPCGPASYDATKSKDVEIGGHWSTFALNIGGMDCIDCLNKVKRAFQPLRGARSTAMDYMRATVQGEYDLDVTDPEAISIFVARATGFTVTVASSDVPLQNSAVEFALRFHELPRRDLLSSLGSRTIHSNGRFKKGGIAYFALPDSRDDDPKPRQILDDLGAYDPELVSRSSQEDKHLTHELILIALRTLVAAILTIPILVLTWGTNLPTYDTKVNAIIQLVLGTCMVAVAYPIYSKSIRSMVYLHQADLGVLITVSTLTAYAFSVVAFIFKMLDRSFADTLFETLALLVTLIYFARTLQVLVRRIALSAIENVNKHKSETANLVGENGELSDHQTTVHPALLHYDDIIRLVPGDIVPTDGVVFSGSAALDEAAITGEVNPVHRSPGSTILAGTTVKDGQVDILVTRLESNNSLAAIVSAARQQDASSEYYDLADKFAGYILWIALAVSVISLLIWLFVSRYVRNETWGKAATEGVKRFIAVLAVACPCALVLNVSLVSSTGLVIGFKHQIIYRSISSLFNSNKIKAFAFDKTGTLSKGNLAVSSAVNDGQLAVVIAYGLASLNGHPISVAVKRHIEDSGNIPAQPKLDDVSVIPGSGIMATFHGYPVRAGNAEFTGTDDHPLVLNLMKSGQSAFIVTLGDRLVGCYGLVDHPREGAAKLLHALQGHTVILSGDHPTAVSRFGASLEVDAIGGLSPSAKAEEIRRLEEEYGKTAFVGDGTNDTLALSAASLSIAVGSGSDIASSTASVVVQKADILSGVQDTLNIAALSRLHLMLGFAWCAIYFLVAILLAAGAAVDFSIPPQWAGLGELVSIAPILIICGSLYLWPINSQIDGAVNHHQV